MPDGGTRITAMRPGLVDDVDEALREVAGASTVALALANFAEDHVTRPEALELLAEMLRRTELCLAGIREEVDACTGSPNPMLGRGGSA